LSDTRQSALKTKDLIILIKQNGGKKMSPQEQKEIEEEETGEDSGFKKQGPLLKTNIRKSKDNKWIIHETVITDIKPVTYFQKVFE